MAELPKKVTGVAGFWVLSVTVPPVLTDNPPPNLAELLTKKLSMMVASAIGPPTKMAPPEPRTGSVARLLVKPLLVTCNRLVTDTPVQIAPPARPAELVVKVLLEIINVPSE